MSVRLRLTAISCGVLALSLVGCDDGFHDGYDGYGDSSNEVVFGIQQRVDPATNKNVVTGSYDFLGLANKGGSTVSVFRDGDGTATCYFERFDDRLGAIQVESGVATFTGGQLPAAGLQILANETEPAKLDGNDGWSGDDRLTFQVTGFAMPHVRTFSMAAPRLDLGGIAITPALASGATDLAIKPSDDITFTWTPVASDDFPHAHVMVTLDTEEDGNAGGGLRCFASPSAGSAVIPAEWVARLFSSVDPAKPIKGHVAVSSHHQVTYYAPGDWTAYIVATTEHVEKSFAGTR